MRCFTFTIAHLISLLLVETASAHDAPPFIPDPSCAWRMDEFSELPRGWGFKPGELEIILQAIPHQADAIRSLVGLAHLVNTPNPDFFDLLGTYANLGFTRTAANSIMSTDADQIGLIHRQAVTQIIAHDAIAHGQFPVHLDGVQIHVMASSLGDLPFADEGDLWARFDRVNARNDAVKAFVRANEIRLRDLVQHSKTAQTALLQMDKRVDEVDGPALLSAFQARLLGTREIESPLMTLILDRAEAAMNGNFVEMTDPTKVPPSASRAVRTKYRQHYEDHYVGRCLVHHFKEFRNSLMTKATTTNKIRHNPKNLMDVYVLFQHEDLLIDRKLDLVLRKGFANVVLGKETLPGRTVLAKIKAEVMDDLTKLRRSWRQGQKDAAKRDEAVRVNAALEAAQKTALKPSTPLGRTERVSQYVAPMPVPTPAEPRPAVAIPVRTPVQELDQADQFWLDLADRSRDLASARAKFEAEVTPGTIYIVPLVRSGFKYRVQFSAELIDQLLHPRDKEPQDLRDWLDALRWGPARDEMQRGWKKLSTPVHGYRWEIKDLRTPYRILGNQLRGGVWSYETIELMH